MKKKNQIEGEDIALEEECQELIDKKIQKNTKK